MHLLSMLDTIFIGIKPQLIADTHVYFCIINKSDEIYPLEMHQYTWKKIFCFIFTDEEHKMEIHFLDNIVIIYATNIQILSIET